MLNHNTNEVPASQAECGSPNHGAFSQWQPIETAPRDGSFVLVCQSRNGIIRTAHWADTWDHWAIASGAMSYISGVTHWMPLPAPPATP